MENKCGKQEEVDVILQKTISVKTNEQNPKPWERHRQQRAENNEERAMWGRGRCGVRAALSQGASGIVSVCVSL